VSSGPALVSILRQGSYLVASDHTALDDTEMIRFRNDLVDQIATFRSKGVIIDVAALDVLDSFGFTTEHRGQRQKAGSGLKSLLRPTRSRDARGTPTATLAVRRNRNQRLRVDTAVSALDEASGLMKPEPEVRTSFHPGRRSPDDSRISGLRHSRTAVPCPSGSHVSAESRCVHRLLTA